MTLQGRTRLRQRLRRLPAIELGLALGASALFVALGVGAYTSAPGSLASRLVLGLSLSAIVALHIQLGRGTIEFHFGVFVALALLMVYRDWRPIVAAAGCTLLAYASPGLGDRKSVV